MASPIVIMDLTLQKIEAHYLQNEYVATLRVALKRIRDITNTILNHQRAEPRKETICILSLVNEVISSKHSEWIDKKYTLDVDLKNIPKEEKILGNSIEIKRLLSNILNNAIEACEKNIKIKVTARYTGNFLEIIISDNGIGIFPEKLSACLQGESSKHTGTGLGLSSAKRYMESIGGEIQLKSHMGSGTEVYLKFNKFN